MKSCWFIHVFYFVFQADLEKLKRDVLNYQCTNEQLSSRVKDVSRYHILYNDGLRDSIVYTLDLFHNCQWNLNQNINKSWERLLFFIFILFFIYIYWRIKKSHLMLLLQMHQFHECFLCFSDGRLPSFERWEFVIEERSRSGEGVRFYLVLSELALSE